MHADTTNDFLTRQIQFFFGFQKVDDAGTKTDKPYVFLELCAGSAPLSAEVKKLGVEVSAFDHDSNRQRTKCSTIDRISEMIHNCVLLGVHIGTPAGHAAKQEGFRWQMVQRALNF